MAMYLMTFTQQISSREEVSNFEFLIRENMAFEANSGLIKMTFVFLFFFEKCKCTVSFISKSPKLFFESSIP